MSQWITRRPLVEWLLGFKSVASCGNGEKLSSRVGPTFVFGLFQRSMIGGCYLARLLAGAMDRVEGVSSQMLISSVVSCPPKRPDFL